MWGGVGKRKGKEERKSMKFLFQVSCPIRHAGEDRLPVHLIAVAVDVEPQSQVFRSIIKEMATIAQQRKNYPAALLAVETAVESVANALYKSDPQGHLSADAVWMAYPANAGGWCRLSRFGMVGVQFNTSDLLRLLKGATVVEVETEEEAFKRENV